MATLDDADYHGGLHDTLHDDLHHHGETGLEDDMNSLALAPYTGGAGHYDDGLDGGLYDEHGYGHEHLGDHLGGEGLYDDYGVEGAYDEGLYAEQEGMYDHYHLGEFLPFRCKLADGVVTTFSAYLL
ncbi:hypothetical protein BT69DRAFT_452281 [Atractiella rhizophila]|nr:hypothetical protein BT69DRAFT_452281 [Atractiella rhizophila]